MALYANEILIMPVHDDDQYDECKVVRSPHGFPYVILRTPTGRPLTIDADLIASAVQALRDGYPAR